MLRKRHLKEAQRLKQFCRGKALIPEKDPCVPIALHRGWIGSSLSGTLKDFSGGFICLLNLNFSVHW